MHELWLLHSPLPLMLIGIYMMCLENILTEQAQFVTDKVRREITIRNFVACLYGGLLATDRSKAVVLV